MRDLDADRLRSAVALKLACGGSLSESTARRFAELIIQDTEQHQIGTFQIVSPPNAPASSGFTSDFGGMEDYSDEGMAGLSSPGGSGYPGLGGGIPGMASPSGGIPGETAAGQLSPVYGRMVVYANEATAAMAANMPPVNKYPGDFFINYDGKPYSVDHGEFSRRLLMIRLLQTTPPNDAEVKNEIGELLAASLLKRYPEGFLPAPPSERDNASVYDLIETEFRSGVRYRKRPTTKKGVLEQARFLDAASGVVWNYLPDDRRKQLQQTRISELQAEQIAATKPKQLYDGLPFETWLSVTVTERSPKRLAEAVAALAILGREGRDAEAAQAILSCLAPFKCDSVNKNDPNVVLAVAVRQGLFKLDQQVLMPAVADTILHGNSNQRRFFFKLNSTWLRAWLEPDGPLMKPQSVSVFLAATHDEEDEIRQLATTYLAPLLLAEGVPLDASEQEKVRDRLIELLADEAVRVPAAVCLSKLAPLTEGLPDILVAEVKRLSNQKLNDETFRLCDVHWALRTLIKNPELKIDYEFVDDRRVRDELNKQLVSLLDEIDQIRLLGEIDQNRDLRLYQSIKHDQFFTPVTLLIETLLEYQLHSGSRSQSFSKSLRHFVVEVFPTKTAAKTYSPILTDDYVYPLAISSYVHAGTRTLNQAANTAAAKWAFEQLEKSSPAEETDN
ncbi:MAG: hypothetical protein ACKVHE_11740 [Planctomycetales bacterium]|jgi:hypothetical protein